MPEEILIIIVLSIVAGTITSLTKMVLSYRERTRGVVPPASTKGSSSSVTTSELERMMHRAVRKATDPLVDRLEELEDRLEVRPALPEKGPRIDLDAALEDREPAMEPRRSRTR